MVKLALSRILVVAASFLGHLGFLDAVDITRLKTSVCANCDAVKAELGFSDPAFDPWADVSWSGYDTELADVNCVVQVNQKASKKQGKLVYSLSNVPSDVSCPDITHEGSCGACSDLKTLALYFENNNLERDASQCGANGLPFIFVANGFPPPDPSKPADIVQNSYALNAMARAGASITIPPMARNVTLGCLLGLGFSDACARVWTSNLLSVTTHCAGECFTYTFGGFPANIPGPLQTGTYPPGFGDNYCQTCPSTVNGGAIPWCYPEASQLGSPFRLVECLQCDECHNGPAFLKYAGRTRRNSGLKSNIVRPPYVISDISHDYCVKTKGGESCSRKGPKKCRAKSPRGRGGRVRRAQNKPRQAEKMI